MHEAAFVGVLLDQAYLDEDPTPESIFRARTAQQRERAEFTRETGVWLKADGRMVHWARTFAELPILGSAQGSAITGATPRFDSFGSEIYRGQRASTVVH